MPIDMCARMIDAASKSCASSVAAKAPASVSTGDGLTALSTAFMYGSLLLGLTALFGAIAWGFVVKGWAEREARIEAERCARKWLEDEAPPIIRREIQEYLRTFPPETPILEKNVDAMAAAAGEDEKEGGNGEEK